MSSPRNGNIYPAHVRIKVEVKVVGYITIQTDLDTFVISVDVTVVGDKLLALPGTIDFGTPLQMVIPRRHSQSDYLTHQRRSTARLQSSSRATGLSQRIIDGHNRIQPGKNVDAMKVTFSGDHDGQYHGVIAVDCVPTGGSDFTVEIPYSAQVLTGSLMYRLGTVELVVRPDDGPVERMVEVTNEFKQPCSSLLHFLWILHSACHSCRAERCFSLASSGAFSA